MSINVEKRLAEMDEMKVCQLQELYEQVFGERSSTRHKRGLIKRIIWRMQANEEGGLSEKTIKRALEIAKDASLRVYASSNEGSSGNGYTKVRPLVTGPLEIMPGTTLHRRYKGEDISVKIDTDGIWYEGERYRSLSAVANKVTGTHWNGKLFFGVAKKKA